jgi:flagellar hook assembly protein FlgD
VYDISGAKVRSLISAEQYQSGSYQIKWDGKDDFGNKLSSGIYFARLDAGRYMQSIKMNLLK